LLETGLWSNNPELCWTLELKLTEKQQAEFRLLAPDESEARADFEREHPELVQQRQALVASVTPPKDLLADQIVTTERSEKHGSVPSETAA
jgi:hypothetical protein